VYRSNEQDFLVAKQQYSQLQTLGNLDAAVTAFKTVQTSRTQTIILYLQTLLSEVTGAKGMDLTQQALETQKLQTMIADYQQHLSDIGAAPDVVALSATATTFTNKEKAFESLSYELLALLRITNMQSAVDQLTVASTLLQTQAQAANLDPTTLATKQRGFDEVSRTIDAVKVFLTQANQFHARLVTQNNYSSSSYSQLAATLGKGYPQVSQAESFLRELAGLPSL
jgi:alpha-galactosidase